MKNIIHIILKNYVKTKIKKKNVINRYVDRIKVDVYSLL